MAKEMKPIFGTLNSLVNTDVSPKQTKVENSEVRRPNAGLVCAIVLGSVTAIGAGAAISNAFARADAGKSEATQKHIDDVSQRIQANAVRPLEETAFSLSYTALDTLYAPTR